LFEIQARPPLIGPASGGAAPAAPVAGNEDRRSLTGKAEFV